MRGTRRGLLVMHYGTPSRLEEVEAYYTHIRRGRPPEPAALADLIARYEAIGGPSPLAAISEQQARSIGVGLRRRGIDATVYVGAKHTHPFVREAVEAMANDNVIQAVGIVLAPHYSSLSIAQYRDYASKARDEFAPEMSLSILERWGALPAFIDALCSLVSKAISGWNPDNVLVIFTAHSLPIRALAPGDPYQEELLETCDLVARRLSLPNWTFAFQSSSSAGEPWLGPDVLEAIEKETRARKLKKVVACTVGFVSDHLEVRYDLGIEARDKCAALGVEFRLAATIDDDPQVMDALAGEAAKLFGA